VFSNLYSDQYSLSRYEITLKITPKSQVFNTYTTNLAHIQNWRPAGERAPKTASFTYRSCHNTIRTQKLNWSENAGLGRARLSSGNRPKSNGLGVSCGKTHCTGSIPVPTLTQNCSSGFEPLLTITATAAKHFLDNLAGCRFLHGTFETHT